MTAFENPVSKFVRFISSENSPNYGAKSLNKRNVFLVNSCYGQLEGFFGYPQSRGGNVVFSIKYLPGAALATARREMFLGLPAFEQ
jgi:hypothetical protein